MHRTHYDYTTWVQLASGSEQAMVRTVSFPFLWCAPMCPQPEFSFVVVYHVVLQQLSRTF